MDISPEEKAKIEEKVRKLRESRFKQQTLPAWRPIPSFRSTMITFTVFGLIFLALGIVLFVMSEKIIENSVQYNTSCSSLNNVCLISFNVAQTIPAPVFIYYQLDNFYQNHRRYVKSRSFNQLKG
jgi:predicted membrane protein